MRAWVLALALSQLFGGIALAQQSMPAAFPSLSEDHWAVRAAWRMEALGLVTAFLPAGRSVPRDAVGRALEEAAARAPTRAPAVSGLAQALYQRFQEQFPAAVPSTRLGGSRPALLGSSAGVGYLEHSGFLSPGTGLGTSPADAVEVPAESGALLRATLAAGITPYVAVLAVPEQRDGFRWRGWDVIAGVGPVSLSVGKQPIGYGWAEGGGVALSETLLDRVQLQSSRPILLPGPLRIFGPVAFHAFLSRFSEDRHPGDPYFLGQSIAFRPHPRLTLGVHRASMFGGDSVDIAVTPRNVGRMLLGIYEGTYGFENQVVAATARFRLPTEALLPVTVYAEWGADDAAGAWWDVPGRIFGLRVPALPHLPQIEAGIEHASFPAACCGNPEWYRHFSHTGNWVKGHRPMGHPIGGHGSEWLLYGSGVLLDARLSLHGRLVWRDRGVQNLYAPDRIGRSRSVTLGASWRVLPFADLDAYYWRDAGDGWRAQQFQTMMSILF